MKGLSKHIIIAAFVVFSSCSSHLEIPEQRINLLFESSKLESFLTKEGLSIAENKQELIKNQIEKVRAGKWTTKSHGDWFNTFYYLKYEDEKGELTYKITIMDTAGENCVDFIYHQEESEYILRDVLLSFDCRW